MIACQRTVYNFWLHKTLFYYEIFFPNFMTPLLLRNFGTVGKKQWSPGWKINKKIWKFYIKKKNLDKSGYFMSTFPSSLCVLSASSFGRCSPAPSTASDPGAGILSLLVLPSPVVKLECWCLWSCLALLFFFFQRYFFVTLVFTDSQLYLELHIEYCLENDVFFLGICCYMIKRSLFDNPSDMRFPFNFQTERKGKFVKLLQEVDQDFKHADSSRHIITT